MVGRSSVGAKGLAAVLVISMLMAVFSGCGGVKEEIPVEELRSFAETIAIEPSELRDGLVPSEAVFKVISTDSSVEPSKNLLSYIKLSPDIEYTLQSGTDGYTLKPNEPLPENSIINATVSDESGNILKSWAFQTTTGLAVTSTMPSDGSNYVPVGTGIEVTFTLPEIDSKSFLDSFTLTDGESGEKVSGTVKAYGNTLVFIPSKPLLFSRSYTAKISSSLATPGGAKLSKDEEFSFTTTKEDNSSYFDNASPVSETFLTSSMKIIAVNCSDGYRGADTKISVAAYKFPSQSIYKEELLKYAGKQNGSIEKEQKSREVDTERLISLGSFTTSFLPPPSKDSWGPMNIQLPEEFDMPGFYYFKVSTINLKTGEPMEFFKFMQVNDVSVYTLQTVGEVLFWLHDSNTGKAAADVNVTVTGQAFKSSSKSGADGIAKVSVAQTKKDKIELCVAEIGDGENAYTDIVTLPSREDGRSNKDYYSYVYTDRPIYQSSDKILIWGVVRPRPGNDKKAPENLRVSIDTYDNSLYSKAVTPSPDGSFTAEIEFKKLAGSQMSYYTLRLMAGEEDTLASKSVTIGDYVKPDYIPEVLNDRLAYVSGDRAKINFSASFFDGTPAHNFKALFSQYSQNNDSEHELVTDENGEASYTLNIPVNYSNERESGNWRPYDISYNVRNGSAENENFFMYGSVPVFPRDMSLLGKLSGEGANRKVTITTNRIDISGITEKNDVYDQDKYIAEPVDAPVTVETHRVYHTKKPNGRSYYDFISKQNIIMYDYESHDELAGTRLYETKGGVLDILDLPLAGKDEFYYFRLKSRDSRGREVIEDVWIDMERRFEEFGPHYFTFQRQNATTYEEQTKFNEGESQLFDVLDNQKKVSSGSVLACVVQDGIKSATVFHTPTARVDYSEQLIPNYYLMGAYFDGKHIYTIDQNYMNFNYDSRKLDISIQPDKESYRPGEKAKITVEASYKDGRPAADAVALLSLTDEAVFAIEEDTANILMGIYRGIYNRVAMQNASFRDYKADSGTGGGAEMGGGGGIAGVRADFKDNAGFLKLTLDKNGKATTEVSLPDNITSWRATAQAVTGDMHAGTKTAPIKVTGDFFLNPILPTSFLSGDKASLSLRAYGVNVRSDSNVDYTVKLSLAGRDTATVTASGRAGDYTEIPLGELKNGEYKVTMSAKGSDSDGKELIDSVEKTVTVVASGVEASIVKSFEIQSGIDIEPARFPVILELINGDYEFYSEVLNALSRRFGNRVDERIAYRFSNEEWLRLSGEEPGTSEPDNLGNVIDTAGGVSLFPYSQSDFALAARVHLAVPEYMVGMEPYGMFMSALGNPNATSNDRAMAYLGLAAHKQPVLLEVRKALSSNEYSDEDKLWLAAALAALGDRAGAAEQYDKLISGRLSEGTDSLGRATKYVADGDINESLRITALMSLTASLLEHPDAEPIQRYLLDNRSTMDLYLLEQIVYLKAFTPKGGDASVSFGQNKRNTTLNLGKQGIKCVYLTEEDFNDLNLKVLQGNVHAKVRYIGGADEAEKRENKEIGLVRKIEPVDGGEIKLGSVVKITLTTTIDNTINPSGLSIDDYIPSGMRFLSVGNEEDDSVKPEGIWSLVSRQGQRLSFSYFNWREEPSPREIPVEGSAYSSNDSPEPQPGQKIYRAPVPLVYYARVASSGEYITESAYISAQFLPIWGSTGRGSVKIG